jgi:hypothetical protein
MLSYKENMHGAVERVGLSEKEQKPYGEKDI